jgi:uncharacterized protein YkwD
MPRSFGQGLAFLLGFWLALALSPFRVEIARADSNAASYAELEARLHQEVNALRARRHLIPLERDPALDAVARAHSADMARRGYLNHVNPEGQNPVDRIHAAGIEGFSLAAENTGLTDRPDPNREILQGWIGSPVHRRNLHAPPFNRTGIGISQAANGAYYYTQLYVTVPRP